jgi:hypothetical protein
MKDKFQLLKELYTDESEYVFKPRKLEDNEPQQESQNENTLWFDLQGNMHFSKENYMLQALLHHCSAIHLFIMNLLKRI